MAEGPGIAAIAALIGDPARANILTALMGGQALTASELAREAGVTPQTASGHLAKLEAAGLTTVRRQGRHKYVALADERVASLLEQLIGLAANHHLRRVLPGPRNAALRRARVCYRHLAGDLGVRLYDSLVADGSLDPSAGLALTAAGHHRMVALKVDMTALAGGRAPLVLPCLDWSARRTHLGGSLGRAVFARLLELGWARQEDASRVVRFTPEGERRFLLAFPEDRLVA